MNQYHSDRKQNPHHRTVINGTSILCYNNMAELTDRRSDQMAHAQDTASERFYARSLESSGPDHYLKCKTLKTLRQGSLTVR